jgi:hypothetical protein
VFARRCFCVRSRPQPSATVGSTTVWGPMGSAVTVVTFGGFKCFVTSFRLTGVALCDIPICFITCQESFCVAGAILLRCFQKMISNFRGRHSTLETSMLILHGRRSTLDVSCCVFFCELHCRGCVKSQGEFLYTKWIQMLL